MAIKGSVLAQLLTVLRLGPLRYRVSFTVAELFDFNDYRSFLRASQRKHPVTKRAITFESWAKRLGYQSPRSIAMVVKGQRIPSRDIVEALSKDLNLNSVRKRYFELLVKREQHEKQGEQLETIQSELRALNHKKISKKILDDSRFTPISEWQNLVLRQLVSTPDFKEYPKWVVCRLRNKLSEETIKKSFELLVRNGYLKRDSSGKLCSPDDDSLWTTHDVPSTAIRRHHAQMMQRAVEALVEQDVSNREFAALTMRFKADRILEAKQAIREFQESFNNTFGVDASNQLFQLNIQFYEHTDGTHSES